ncbi:MAG: Zinc uptake regulation protein [Alphaproteobacteria bacterium MarineAlpha3_Bin5]|nr:MAG: Zinc uptake regulation protein [Alphaproteobacteria bacterium MarineAlpha3_Bin5]
MAVYRVSFLINLNVKCEEMITNYKSSAIERCYEGNFSLTPQRLMVLEAVSEQEKPISAYDLRAKIKKIGADLNIATIYRILDFWCNLSLVHRISAINKFVRCTAPEEKHIHVINCCQKCEDLVETCNEAMGLDLERGTAQLGLSLTTNGHIEIPVICSRCG